MELYYFFSLILCIFLCFTPISKGEKTNTAPDDKYQDMLHLTDANFDKEIATLSEDGVKWFLIFYVDTCAYCKKAIETLNEEIVPQYEDNDKIRFGGINCNTNIWLSIRFNITYIPYMVLLEKDNMYEFKNHLSPESFEKFINEEKTIEDALKIPVYSTYFFLFKTIAKESYILLKDNIQQFMKNHGYNIQISNYVMIGIIVGSIFMLVLIETMLLKCLCGGCCFPRKEPGKNEPKKETEMKDLKDSKNEKKEEKKDEGKKEEEKKETSHPKQE